MNPWEQDRFSRRLAVALQYQAGADDAPRVTAKGFGFVADAIMDVAKRHGVPLHQDEELGGLLASVEIDDSIPHELFEAVAEVLAFVYRMNMKADTTS